MDGEPPDQSFADVEYQRAFAADRRTRLDHADAVAARDNALAVAENIHRCLHHLRIRAVQILQIPDHGLPAANRARCRRPELERNAEFDILREIVKHRAKIPRSANYPNRLKQTLGDHGSILRRTVMRSHAWQ